MVACGHGVKLPHYAKGWMVKRRTSWPLLSEASAIEPDDHRLPVPACDRKVLLAFSRFVPVPPKETLIENPL